MVEPRVTVQSPQPQKRPLIRLGRLLELQSTRKGEYKSWGPSYFVLSFALGPLGFSFSERLNGLREGECDHKPNIKAPLKFPDGHDV